MNNKQKSVKLRRELNRKMVQANSLLEQLRRDGYGDLTIIDRSLKQFQKIVGGSKNVFEAGRLSYIEKRMAIRSIDKFISSKWVTEKGREDILNNRIKAFTNIDSQHEYGLTEEQTLKLFDVFASKEYHKMINKKYLDSEQIIDIVRTNDNTANDIIIAMADALKDVKSEYQARIEIETRLQ